MPTLARTQQMMKEQLGQADDKVGSLPTSGSPKLQTGHKY